MVCVTFAHSISPVTSRSSKRSSRILLRDAASATSENFRSSRRGGSPPTALGQKYCNCRSAAEWNVRVCTPPAPSCRSRPRISPAARWVNVTASTVAGWKTPARTPYAMRWVIARVLPVPAPASTQTGP